MGGPFKRNISVQYHFTKGNGEGRLLMQGRLLGCLRYSQQAFLNRDSIQHVHHENRRINSLFHMAVHLSKLSAVHHMQSVNENKT